MLYKARHTFTMIELLIVIAIIVILAAMLLPALNKARARGQSVACVNQLRQHGNLFILYGDSYNGKIYMYQSASGSSKYYSHFLNDGGFVNARTSPLLVCPSIRSASTIPLYAPYGIYHPGTEENYYNATFNNAYTKVTDTDGAVYFVLVTAKLRKASEFFWLADTIKDWLEPSLIGSAPVLNSKTARGFHFRHVHRCNMLYGDGHVSGNSARELHEELLKNNAKPNSFMTATTVYRSESPLLVETF